MKERSLRVDEIERLCAIAPVGLCYVDADLRYRYINEWLARMNGLPVEVHAGARIDELVPDVAAGIVAQLRRVFATGEPIIDGNLEARTPAHPGESRWYRHSYYPDTAESGSVKGVCCVVRDVTDERRQEHVLAHKNQELEVANARLSGVLEQLRSANSVLEIEAQRANKAKKELEDTKTKLERLALYDSLTGLGNRDRFLVQLEHLISAAMSSDNEVALLALDLDGFKSINDRLGHAAGDEVLRDCAARLRSVLRQSDHIYRIGGDEFAVLLTPGRMALDGAMQVAKRIARAVTAPMNVKGESCAVGISIGVSIFPQHGKEPGTLLRKADAAMYEAKSGNQAIAAASDLSATTVLKRLRSEK